MKTQSFFVQSVKERSVVKRELVSFLKNYYDREEICGFYFDENLKNFVVKFTSSNTYKDSVCKAFTHTDKDGHTVELIAEKANDFVHCVRLFNVPCEITNEMLVKEMGIFGTIFDIQDEIIDPSGWRIPNGNKTINMNIEDELPTRIEVAGQRIKVFCGSLKKVCFQCGKDDHLSDSCEKSKPPVSSNSNKDEVDDNLFKTEIQQEKSTAQVSTLIQAKDRDGNAVTL